LVDSRYIEPENNKRPVEISLDKIDFCLDLSGVDPPIKNNKNAWYI
jgi:hypothetical protein